MPVGRASRWLATVVAALVVATVVFAGTPVVADAISAPNSVAATTGPSDHPAAAHTLPAPVRAISSRTDSAHSFGLQLLRSPMWLLLVMVAAAAALATWPLTERHRTIATDDATAHLPRRRGPPFVV